MYSQNAIMNHFFSYPYVSLSNIDASSHFEKTLSFLESYYTQTQVPINESNNLSLTELLPYESNISNCSFNALLNPTLLYPFIPLPPIMSTLPSTTQTNSSIPEPQNPAPKMPSNKTHANGAMEMAFQVAISAQPTKTNSVPSTSASVLGTEKEISTNTNSDKHLLSSEPRTPSMANKTVPIENAKISSLKRSISYPNERASSFPLAISKSKLSSHAESKSVSPTSPSSLQESRKHSIHSRKVSSKLENDENRCSNSKPHLSPSYLSSISTHNLRITPARTITPSATHKHPTSGSKLASFPLSTKTKLASKLEHCEDSPPKDKIELLSKPDEMWRPSGPGEKPPYSYATLIAQAILSAHGRSRNLSSIYDWIVDSYSFFDKADNGWKNSIRHNLSLNKDFVKTDVKVDGEKGCRWTIAESRISHWLEMQWRHSQAGGVNKAVENSTSKNKSKNKNLDDNSDSDEDSRLDKSKSGKTKKKGLEQSMTLYRPEDFARPDFGKGGVRGTRRFMSSPLRDMGSVRTPPPPSYQKIGSRTSLSGIKRRNHDSHENWHDGDKENFDPQSKKRLRQTLCGKPFSQFGVFSDEDDFELSATEFSSDEELAKESRSPAKLRSDSYFSPKEWLKSDASILMSSPTVGSSLPLLAFASSSEFANIDSLPNSQELVINPYWTTEQAEHLLDSDPNLFSSPIRTASSHLMSFKDPTLIGSSPLVSLGTGSAAFNRLSSPGYDLGFETPEDCRYHSSLRNGLLHPEFFDASFGVDPDKLDFTGIRGEQFGVRTPERKLPASPIRSIVGMMGSPMLKSPLTRVNTWGI